MTVTFVLIPGLISDERVWRPLAEALAGRPVLHANVQEDTTIEAMAERQLLLFDGPFVAAGHSMGGRVAMEMARQAPDRAAGLILSNTGHHPRKQGEEEKREAKIALGHQDMAALVAEWLPPMVDPDRVADKPFMAGLATMAVRIGPQVHERQIRALLARPDAAIYLPQIACPVLLLTGAQDGWSPEAQHREIAALAPSAEVRVIDHAGHFLPLERPDETVVAILDWLAAHEEDLDV